MKKILISVFILSASINVLANVFGWENFSSFSKPIIMLALIAFYWTESQQKSMIFILAMIMCWAGDVFLMFQAQSELYFMAGLGSFLLGHILYIISYQQHRWTEGNGLLGPQKVRFSLPIILAGSGLVVILYPALGGLKVPVMLYALVITLMALQALLRYGFTTVPSFIMIFLGAILFMISDSVLAFNKFLSPVPLAGGIIMSTYCSAQFLIVLGILHHTNNKN